MSTFSRDVLFTTFGGRAFETFDMAAGAERTIRGAKSSGQPEADRPREEPFAPRMVRSAPHADAQRFHRPPPPSVVKRIS